MLRNISYEQIILAQRDCSHQQTNGTGVVLCSIVKDLKERAGRGANDTVDVSGNEEQNNEEDRASDGADCNAVYHNFGSLDGWVWNFYGSW